MTDLADRRELETDVYQPAEDSRLLASAAAGLLDRGDLAIEAGTGSGWVAEHLAALGATVVGSDLNPHACRATADRGVPVVRADLLTPFRTGVADLVCCNPPYLPADDRAARDDWVELALTGGTDGRAVVDRFLADVGRVLRPDGTACLVVSSLTDVAAVRETAGEAGLSSAVLAEESHPFETLVALELRPD